MGTGTDGTNSLVGFISAFADKLLLTSFRSNFISHV